MKTELKNRDVEALANILKQNPDVYKTIGDVPFVKDVIASSADMIAAGVAATIRQGGWEQLMSGSDTNKDIWELIGNPSVILYTQLVMALTLVAAASPAPEGLESPNRTSQPVS